MIPFGYELPSGIISPLEILSSMVLIKSESVVFWSLKEATRHLTFSVERFTSKELQLGILSVLKLIYLIKYESNFNQGSTFYYILRVLYG